MGIREGLVKVVSALLGVSAYSHEYDHMMTGVDVDDPIVKRTRKYLGGNIQPLPTTRLRWYLKDLEIAQAAADGGYMKLPAQLYRAMQRDGTIRGLLGTRTAGLVRLPKRFYGSPRLCRELRAKNDSRAVFDEMCPPSELALMAGDGIALGVSLGELVPVEGRDYPVLIRLNPEFLQFRWNENRWYFNSIAGALPITPGDGRWVLHVPGGRLEPWNAGCWPALGRAFINKEHAMLHRANYSAKLANPARAAFAPAGATELQRRGFFQRLLAWGKNTVFEMPPGWDVKLIEANGRGWEVFQREIDTSDLEIMIALAGQTPTTTGGVGFSNINIPEAIRQDLIQETGQALAYTVNTQILPAFAVNRYGIDALNKPCWIDWDTSTPADLEKTARTLSQLGPAIVAIQQALALGGQSMDLRELALRFDLPLGPEIDIVEMPMEDTLADADDADEDKQSKRPRLVA